MPRFFTDKCELVHNRSGKLLPGAAGGAFSTRPAVQPPDLPELWLALKACALARSPRRCEGAGLESSEFWALAKDSRKALIASVSVVT